MSTKFHQCSRCKYWRESSDSECPKCGGKNNLMKTKETIIEKIKWGDSKLLKLQNGIREANEELSEKNKDTVLRMLKQAYKAVKHQKGALHIKLWEFDIVLIQNKLQPLYFNQIKYSDDDYKETIESLTTIIEEGKSLQEKLSEKQSEHIDYQIKICDDLEDDLVKRSIVASLRDVDNSKEVDEQVPPILDKLIDEKKFLVDLSKVESEIIRISIENEISDTI